MERTEVGPNFIIDEDEVGVGLLLFFVIIVKYLY